MSASSPPRCYKNDAASDQRLQLHSKRRSSRSETTESWPRPPRPKARPRRRPPSGQPGRPRPWRAAGEGARSAGRSSRRSGSGSRAASEPSRAARPRPAPDEWVGNQRPISSAGGRARLDELRTARSGDHLPLSRSSIFALTTPSRRDRAHSMKSAPSSAQLTRPPRHPPPPSHTDFLPPHRPQPFRLTQSPQIQPQTPISLPPTTTNFSSPPLPTTTM